MAEILGDETGWVLHRAWPLLEEQDTQKEQMDEDEAPAFAAKNQVMVLLVPACSRPLMVIEPRYCGGSVAIRISAQPPITTVSAQ